MKLKTLKDIVKIEKMLWEDREIKKLNIITDDMTYIIKDMKKGKKMKNKVRQFITKEELKTELEFISIENLFYIREKDLKEIKKMTNKMNDVGNLK